MSGFGKNPWDNRGMGNQGSGNQGFGNYQQQGMMGNPNPMMGSMGGGLGSNQSMPPAGISYPTPRGSQGGGFGQSQQQQQPMKANNPSNRVFTGTVTKLHDNFGFVDDDVFFQANVCKGPPPRVGDRVLVEATYNANMPFKWNATRVTPLPGAGASNAGPKMGQGGLGSNMGGLGSNMGGLGSNMGGNHQMGGFGSGRGFGNDGGNRDRDRSARNRSPIRRPDVKRDDRERSSRKRSRSKSASKARSPPRRKAKHQPRYNVSVPKVSLNFPATNVVELQKRYKSLYIPSDFFAAKHVWNQAFPIHAPFNIEFPSMYHIFNKEHVDPISHNKFQYDPPDAEYAYVAKVMLLASPGLETLYDKTCHLIEKDADSKDGREGLVHPSRAIKFLVGLKGKSETMAIGGPWSPSLDGGDPKNDPSVLIKTAIRTCGAMTGIDLSNCTQWTRFNEIHYRRQATSTKPARTETVVIFFPDVWSCMPSKIDYDEVCATYASKCALKCEGKSVKLPDLDETVDMDASVNEDEDDGEEVKKGDPTPWKDLTPKNMKVNELKGELEARGQSSKGLKSQLQARLQKLLASEQEAEEKKNIDGEPMEETSAEDKEEEASEDSKVPDAKEQEKIKGYYKTPSSPALFVHPDTKVKSGKFDCRVESLSVLLDYRSDDNKEGTFEISHFAELFNEMLMRDSAFKIYRTLANAPDKPKEEKKKEDKKDEKKSEEKNDDEKVDDKEEEEKKKKEADEKIKKKEEEEKKKKEEEEKQKNMITRDKDLLMACSYFDLSHIGYFEAKDLEDIFLTLELDLSRAEVKKLAHKLTSGSREHVNYRSLTDVEAGAPEKDAETGALSDKELAAGFKQYVPGSGDDAGAAASTAILETNNLVKFRGSVLDIEKLMAKMDKSEKVRLASDTRLVTIQKELQSVKDQTDKLTGQRDKLAAELKANREKTKEIEGDLMMTKGDGAKYKAALKDILLRVEPLFPPPPKVEVAVEAKPTENGVSDEPEAKKAKVEETKVKETKVEVKKVEVKKVEVKKVEVKKDEEMKEDEAAVEESVAS